MQTEKPIFTTARGVAAEERGVRLLKRRARWVRVERVFAGCADAALTYVGGL